MKSINLVDNRRYFLEDEKHTLPEKEFNILKSFACPISISTQLKSENFILLNELKNSDNNNCVLKYGYENGKEYIGTGNLIGKFYLKDKKEIYEVNIGLRFDDENSNDVLEFLLDYAEGLYAKNIDINSKKKNKKNSNKVIETILIKMFINSISKAIIMGLPAIYKEEYENSYNFKGRIDINNLIAKELPFKGKVPHIKNEKVIVRSIASVILKAIEMIHTRIVTNFKLKYKTKTKQKENNEELKESLRKIAPLLKVRNYIKQSITPMIITKQLLQEALHHKILNHQSFYEYKNTLKLALLILDNFQEVELDNIKGESFGYLCDVSKLWEKFLVRFLNETISDENMSEDWEIKYEPKLKIFENMPNFAKRENISNKMIPDIIVENKTGKKVMIFDAKFKQSIWFNREDFYKTVTYIFYYITNGYKVVFSGQIYPDTELKEINQNVGLFKEKQIYPDTKLKEEMNKNTGLFKSDIDFRFFGIDLKKRKKNPINECEFIKRIKEKMRKGFKK